MFTPQEKLVYSCSITNRAYDPLVLKRAISIESKGQFNKLVASKTPEAEGELVRIARKVFSLVPIAPDGSGTLDATALEALTLFTRWLSGKDKREQTSPTSAPSSAGPAVGPSATPTSSC